MYMYTVCYVFAYWNAIKVCKGMREELRKRNATEEEEDEAKKRGRGEVSERLPVIPSNTHTPARMPHLPDT